jgi:hypothetical protein
MSLRSKYVYVIVAFIAGIFVAVVTPIILGSIGESLLPTKRVEIARSTSPDGLVDAVMVRDNCGALCSYMYSVSVVPKGSKASDETRRNILIAEDMAGEKIVWNQPHLLELVYEKALIRDFRNVAYPLAKSGVPESWKYIVEARLAPKSPDFSYLPNGNNQ